MSAQHSDKPGRASRIPKWMAPYLEASWGIRNHWYPALFSHELADGAVKPITIAGENILLRRSKGRVHALKDECVHRGVRISARPTCLTEDTVTCWYHGFTYNLEDGKLCNIVAAPEDPLIGKVGIRTYAVEEVNGMIFVFLGDEGYAPPPLAHDLPRPPDPQGAMPTAYLLDENTMALGIRRTCVGNWRLAAESGGDPGHVMIHRNSALILSQEIGLALGEKRGSGESIRITSDNGPVGVTKFYENMEFVMENSALNIHAPGGNPPLGVEVSLFLPGVLFVENWPRPGLAQYEWYVPIDEHNHEYWQVLTKTCNTEAERQDFQLRYDHVWEELALKSGFNDDDVFAREAMEDFYRNDRGWAEERLFELDEFVVHWRRLVVKHARGIQPAPDSFPAGR
jgi:phenylpropionate dioxygenase-like ring-hydroxylating dioxygenase large terminal subunit